MFHLIVPLCRSAVVMQRHHPHLLIFQNAVAMEVVVTFVQPGQGVRLLVEAREQNFGQLVWFTVAIEGATAAVVMSWVPQS